MRSLTGLATLGVLFALSGSTVAQTPSGTTSSSGKTSSGTSSTTGSPSSTTRTTSARSALELALEAALRSNPDLRVAMARLNEAEAELARVRLQVAQKVVTAYRALEQGQTAVKAAEENLALALRASVRNPTSVSVRKAEHELADAKARLAGAQSELDYLVGKPTTRETSPQFRTTPLSQRYFLGEYNRTMMWPPARDPGSDRIRKALEARISIKAEELTARALLEQLRKAAPGLHIQASMTGTVWDEKVTASLTDVPLSSGLELLEDVLTGLRIVVRSYGLLIVPQERVPPGTMLLAEYLKGSQTTTTPKK